MRKSARVGNQLDYQKLNSTGEVVFKDTITGTGNQSNNQELGELSTLLEEFTFKDPKMDKVIDDVETTSENIDDYIEENPTQQLITSKEDLDSALEKIYQLRTMFRSKHKELKRLVSNYDDLYGIAFNAKMDQIKCYIKDANDARHKIRLRSFTADQETANNEDQQVRFVLADVSRLLDQLNLEMKDDLKVMKHEEVLKCKENLKDMHKKIDAVSLKVSTLLGQNMLQDEVHDIVKRYEATVILQSKFTSKLESEILKREIHKESLFQESKLNIKLGKFKGYSSAADIYSFQDDFEKIYSRTTPKRLMPDLLKNNHLEEPALSMVKSNDDIEEIWSRLKSTYGNPKIMLNKRMKQIESFDSLWKIKDAEKTVDAMGKIVNTMKDLVSLCKRHGIESKLFNGDAIEKVYKVLGDRRVTRWITSICDKELEDEDLWMQLITFIERDMKVEQHKMLLFNSADASSKDTKFQERRSGGSRGAYYTEDGNMKLHSKDQESCSICNSSNGQDGHIATNGPRGIKFIQYFTCKKFVEMHPRERFAELRSNNLCFQCLLPGASLLDIKHKEGKCQRDFSCQHPSHSRYPTKKHVLVCEDHKDTKENMELLQRYKERCILRHKSTDLPTYSKDIKLSFYTSFHQHKRHDVSKSAVAKTKESNDVINEKGIYQLQTIKVGNQNYTIFYDSGCSEFVSKYSAMRRIGDLATLEFNGPINLGGVGGVMSQSRHGIYNVKLPLADGQMATMSGVCIDRITATFPQYPLQGKVEMDIKDAYQSQHGSESLPLPRLPKSVGGDVDFMIGIKYLRYHPEFIYQLPSGLTIYKSKFQNADGKGYGVIGGPHEVFTSIEKYFNLTSNHQSTFFANQLMLYRDGYQINPDLSILGWKDSTSNLCDDIEDNNKPDVYYSKKIKIFNEAEETGSQINYRCIRCRSCLECKQHDQVEAISIREEVEQDVINKSVVVDVISRTTCANLPFMHNPEVKLAPNKHKALKVYQQQVKKLSKNQKDKDDVIHSESKLQSLGYVDYVKNLSSDQFERLQNSKIQNYIPWRSVWKSNSISTPCRLVFDASQQTGSGYSLNDILAKGRNNMNKLQEILLRWLIHPIAFHTDVRKMYNAIKLNESDWCYQRYIWQENLDPSKIPDEKVIKTLIYGVRSSGNQAELGLRKTAKITAEEFPEIANVVCNDFYVDDCMSGEVSIIKAKEKADQLEIILNKGGFALKGVSFSGENPPECLSEDGISVCVAGMKWYPKDDVIAIDIGDLNFSSKTRGRKLVTEASTQIPTVLTRRQCASKVAEVFDLTGKVMPLISSMKLDLRELVQRKIDWDDNVPEELYSTWISNFEMMQQIKDLRYNRAIVPSDAVNLDIETIDFGDASTSMACAAIYARFKRQDGSYSSQLVFARSKLIPEGTSQPRAELVAALLNSHTGEVIKRSFGKYHKSHIKLCDSQIVLHWLKNEEKPLKQWVRNRVLEVKRFTDIEDWYHIDGKNMLADIGTRKGKSIKDVNQESIWINGYDWMKGEVKEMPIKSILTLNLNQCDASEVKKEVTFGLSDTVAYISTTIAEKVPSNEVLQRYKISNYIIDPNKYHFSKVVRIMAYVLKFIKHVRSKVVKDATNRLKSAHLCLNEVEVKEAQTYFYKKATLEVKHFNNKKTYEHFSKERNSILWYTGRILPTDQVTIVGKYTEAMKDLSSSTFCVPVIDKHSPLAYAIINDVHWYDKSFKHSGVETTWRQVLKTVFIIEGRNIVKIVKKSCERCRYLGKKCIDVAMGPVSKVNMMIAPPFYICQVDLAGPFLSYSQHHKRTTVKVWMAVFCCTTTSTVNIKMMENYTSTAFIQAFIRLSCEVGYPKMLLPDEGSQLVKACETMKLSFKDIKSKLFCDAKVEFDVCPVGGHNMHGKVERKIKEIKSSFEKHLYDEKLSIIEWETVVAEIGNSINNMPLALGNLKSDFESMDLITPNRLKLGRNNDRSPEGILAVSSNPDKFMKTNQKIFESWFENWLMNHLPKLMHQPKWFKTEYNLQVGDIVLFRKQDSVIQSKYQYGKVKSISKSNDGLIRKASVEYRNCNEKTNRETYRSVRELIVIHGIDELDIIQELGEIGIKSDLYFQKQNFHKV